MKNPQAFPSDESTQTDKGITLFNYFAGQALVGFLANWNAMKNYNNEEIATATFGLAKAMLKESEKHV